MSDGATEWAGDAAAEILRTIAEAQAITVRDGRVVVELQRDGVWQPPGIGFTVQHIIRKHALAAESAISDPSTWPTDPPTEPGWWWFAEAWSGGVNALHPAELVLVEVVPDGPAAGHLVAGRVKQRTSDLLSTMVGRWRPGRIVP